MTDLQAVGVAYQKLHPQKFYARIWETVRGGLPAASLGSDGGRSAEKPIPRLDAEDRNTLALRDSYKQRIAAAYTLTREGNYTRACQVLEYARIIESAVLPELHMTTSELVEHMKWLRRLADEDAGQRHKIATKCKNGNHEIAGESRWVEGTTADPLCGGRCHLCHNYFSRERRERPVAAIVKEMQKAEGTTPALSQVDA